MAPIRENDGHQQRHAGIFPVSRGNEIRNRGEFLRLCQLHDPANERHQQQEYQDGTDIDAGKFQSFVGGKAHAAEIGPEVQTPRLSA